MRGDPVLPELLGMDKIASEDALRRALSAMPEDAAKAWLESNLQACLEPLLAEPYILDIDSTVKPLYGRQECAAIGYNPTKPGRPSHVHHTDMMAGLRLVMGVKTVA
ncbi:MAG: transposase, partial [Pseudomonadota bacterium]